MTLSDIYDFVHRLGNWQAENCYETIIYKHGDYYVIANVSNWGTHKDEPQDSVGIISNGKKGKVGDMWKGEQTCIDKKIRTFLLDLEKIHAFDEYVIEMEDKQHDRIRSIQGDD